MPAWCRPCAKCLRSRRSWGCRPFVLAVLLRRWCSGRCRVRPPARHLFPCGVACGPAGVPGTGGPGRCVCRWAAARPRAVRAASFARRVASKPGQAPPLPINFARNSPAACSIIEFASLELQCFWGVSKNDHDKLRAKFGRRRRLVADVLLGALLRSQAGSRASTCSLSSVSHAIP